MPTTYTLDAISKPFPLITNRIRAAVYSESDPFAMVAFLIDTTALHPQRTWHFTGLPRDNYKFSLDEIDGSDNVLTNLSLFDVVPGLLEGSLERADEQIRVGSTPGFITGGTTIVFDGSEDPVGSGLYRPDYTGWDIVPSELTGRGILVEGTDYSWNKDTATFTLLQAGDTLPANTWYNIHFNPRTEPSAGNSVSTVNDIKIKLITDSYTLTPQDFGGGIIIESAVEYMELTFPDITTVREGRLLRIQTGDTGDMYCVKFVSASIFIFGKGAVYMNPNESLVIYKYIHPTTGSQWRIAEAVGNFLFCGNIISNDTAQIDVFGMQLLDGSELPVTSYARLYNQFVLNLPIGWAVPYVDWGTGDNKRKFSLASGGFFKIPDRRDLYERFLLTGNSGDYQADMVGPHTHMVQPPNSRDTSGAGKLATGNEPQEGIITPFPTQANSGTETRPKSYLTNKYIVL